MSTFMVSELLKSVSEAEDKVAKLKVAVKQNPALVEILKTNFVESAAFVDLDPGYPEQYQLDDAPPGLAESTLAYEQRKFNRFRDAQLDSKTRRTFFLRLLEGLHKDEAEVLVFAKDKALQEVYPAITAELVKEAGIL